MTTTATTVSAQGITKITRHNIMTEADTGSGSTVRPGGNASSAGDTDSHPSSLHSDMMVAPRFKVVVLNGEDAPVSQ